MSELIKKLKEAQSKTLHEKELELKAHSTNVKYDSYLTKKVQQEKASRLDLKNVPGDYFEKLSAQYVASQVEYKNYLPFITNKLSKLVPLYYPNLILVGALTGSGKTTASANIVHRLLKEKKKVLILSNEELVLDIYTRLACLELDLNINDRLCFTDEQHNLIKSKIPEIGEYVRVVDLEYDNNKELTSSVEGMRAIFQHLEKEKIFDCIIIDYYQKVSKSDNYQKNANHQVLQDFTDVLDKYYKTCHAPVVVMCQLHPTRSEDTSFESRIKLGKSILISSTLAVEIESDKTKLETKWTCHKGRWGNQGARVITKWSKGKFTDSEDSNG